MVNLLQMITTKLAAYLGEVLPSLFDDWWKQGVIDKLSFQQNQRIEQGKINSLGKLDLAALLRILDQNWYKISNKKNLPMEARHYFKEMQTIRNRWAHANAEGLSADDTYRDLDTLQRFALFINVEESFIQEIREAKEALLTPRVSPSIQNYAITNASKEFEPGQIVCLKSNPIIRGAVLNFIPGGLESRVKVFVNGEIQMYYASQLQAEKTQDANMESLPYEQFHSFLTALQIKYPALSTLYSLNAARVDFIPYQFRPVLRFIKSDRPRLLIADGVGVGKTIEAGLLRELQARRDIRSVLIVCPRPLVTERKWENEMKRFEERFTHLNGATLRHCINEMDLEGEWPAEYRKSIVPYSLFDASLLYGSSSRGKGKQKKGLLDLDPPPRFDLVIVDEAHHIRNQDTFSHEAVRFFCDHAEAVVFLTATPIQLGSHDLYVLLNTLRPDLIIDEQSFEHMAEPNPSINQAAALVRAQQTDWNFQSIGALEQAASTDWGKVILQHNPDFNRIRSRIVAGDITNEERIQMIKDIESLHTFSGIINRTRRRDIGEFTVRKPETVTVEFTPVQRELHNKILTVEAEIFSRLHGDLNVKFMLTTIRRQAASSLYGLVPFLEEILNRHIDELSWEETDNEEPVPSGDAINSIQSQIQVILEMVKQIDPYDPKLEALRKVIQDKQSLTNNKAMLFSSFRHTLEYLYENLKTDGFRVAMIHGGTPDEERMELKNRFEKPREDSDSLDLILFSEIGCEGLDYQFCDCIINYDLPWNPMKVEQRIGRIDRNGQKSESVAIINLITPGTVDADIYNRCLMRIGVFNNALGAGEEILGEIATEIKNIAENYALNDEERRAKLQQLADNKIRLIQEQEELEQRQMELFGIRLPENTMNKEIEEASSFWLSPTSIHRMVAQYLQQRCGREQEFILGDKSLKTLRLSQEARSSLLQDFQKLSKQNTKMYRAWENWLKGGNPHFLLTFESDCASLNPQAAFIMPLHPLVKQAAISFETGKRVATALKVESNDVPAGGYKFAIYQWRFHGIREDLVLKPVASSNAITPYLGKLLEKAENANMDENISTTWDELDDQHYKLWSETREQHKQRTKELAEYRRESLSVSHRARMALLNEQLAQSTNEKIQKMKQSQIGTAEADYARHIQELDIAIERADVTAEVVAYGVIQIEEVNHGE
jgi:superfamily II DNA or RNA helicase